MHVSRNAVLLEVMKAFRMIRTFVFCPGIATIICGLLALIILYTSRGSKNGTILAVLIVPIIPAFIIIGSLVFAIAIME